MKILNIAKNTSYFTLALIVQKIISFSYFTIIARNLLPDDLGKYYFAISFTTIFAIFIDLGLSNVLMREVPKIKEKIKEGKWIDSSYKSSFFDKLEYKDKPKFDVILCWENDWENSNKEVLEIRNLVAIHESWKIFD